MRLLRRGVIGCGGAVPTPTEQEILRALSVPHAHRIDEIEERGVREAVELARERAFAMATYEGVFRVLPVLEVKDDEILVTEASPGFLRSKALARRFQGVKEAVLLAVTLGERWDEALDSLAKQGEPAEAWFLDAIGTLLVDRAARHVEAQAGRDLTRLGLGRAGRYRPGYGDLPLACQAELCALLDTTRIGVTPNEAMSLWPRKSVTTLVGFRPDEERSSTP